MATVQGSQLGRTERLTLSLSFPLLKESPGSFPAPKPAHPNSSALILPLSLPDHPAPSFSLSPSPDSGFPPSLVREELGDSVQLRGI